MSEQLTRRTLTRGAMWTVPTVVVGAVAPKAAATVNCVSPGGIVVNYTTGAPVVVTVAAGCSRISYTVVGGDGAGGAAGRGAVLTGTINITNMNVAQTLYVIAGGGGTMVNEESPGNGSGVAAGGKGYGNGGDAVAAATGSWHGGGGAGSAILLASSTPAANGAGVTPLVVAGGGGGSAGFQKNGNGSDTLSVTNQLSGAGGTGTASAGVYSTGTTGSVSTGTWKDSSGGTSYALTVPSGTGASGATGGAAGATPTVSPNNDWFAAVGVAGQNHGLGAYGGGNGGNGPTPLPAAMTTLDGVNYGMNPGGGGGGGWAGGGGGTSGLVKSTPGQYWCTLGAGGGGGTSYAAPAAVPNVVVGNGAVTVTNTSAASRTDTRSGAYPWALNGSVTISWA